jgi:hypothetical protein
MQKKPAKKTSVIEKLAIGLLLVIAVNIGALVLINTQQKTILLLKKQYTQLVNDQKIITSSEAIYQQYEKDIDTILSVFPDETTVLDFIQKLEVLSKQYAESSSVRLSARDPLPEGDKLFLLFNLTLKTDKDRLDEFMEELENLPYMTRTLSVDVRFPEKQLQKVDATFSIKLYVKNPFTAK